MQSLYFWCNRPSDSLRAIRAELTANHDVASKKGIKPNPGDLVVNWGSAHAPEDALNATLIHNKYRQLEVLQAKSIPVPQHTRIRETTSPGWLARLDHHQEANDLLANLSRGDYYVKQIPTVEEWRVHIFAGKSIRAGKKVPRIETPHPVFRSWTGGWRLSYTGTSDAIREMAAKAVKAVGYDFGAVDLAVKPSGSLVVWEVNSAPGLEGGTIKAYAAALAALAKGA